MYTSLFSSDAPPLLEQLADTPEMRRLSRIGMHCGVDYASYPIYQNARCPYSRRTHSIGVARIVWNFTHDLKQAVAGLLHDISTPVFAHTIDFLNDDHMNQESTEDGTRELIEGSKAIMALLKQHHLRVDDVADYHRYPIADNDTPMLCADRLEYTLGNGYAVYHMSIQEIKELYDDLFVAKNENSFDELAFRDLEMARKFTELALRNSCLFVSDGDRFSMQFLADIIRHALDAKALSPRDLYTTEDEVIGRLKQDADLAALWRSYTETSKVAAAKEEMPDRYCVNVSAKKRYINPLVLDGNRVERITELDFDLRSKTEAFLNLDFDQWIYAE